MNTLPTDLLKIIRDYKIKIDHSIKMKKSFDKIKSIDYLILKMPIKNIINALPEEDQNDLQLIQLIRSSSIKNYKNRTISFYWYGNLIMTITDKYNNCEMYEIEEETTNNITYTNVLID